MPESDREKCVQPIWGYIVLKYIKTAVIFTIKKSQWLLNCGLRFWGSIQLRSNEKGKQKLLCNKLTFKNLPQFKDSSHCLILHIWYIQNLCGFIKTHSTMAIDIINILYLVFC
jgi:hypothetical protein